MATAFDILGATHRLEEAGLPREQAEAIAAEAGTAAQSGRDDLVTKSDLTAALAELEARLLWRLVGGMVAVAGLAIAIAKLI
ncbi:MAG: hypothetical protein OXH52_15870 [Gammaproteobacteria bacterium]|nr:hypothetical protein [Gammaproteobacteria bacterium]